MGKILVLFQSASGNTAKMADLVAEGAKLIPGIEVRLREVLAASPEDVHWCDGLAVGSPTNMGILSWKMKRFWDETMFDHWGKVDGKIACAFSSSGGWGGGAEMVGLADLRIDDSLSRPVSPEERERQRRREVEEYEQRMADILGALVPRSSLWTSWIGSRGATWIIVLLIVMITLFVFAQAALLVAQVEALAPVWRYLGYASAGLLLLAFAIAMVRLCVLYVRLRRSPTLRIDALQLLAKRQMIRSEHIDRAFTHVLDSLRPIVVEYPVDRPMIARLRGWGADDAHIADLLAARERLLLRHEGPEEWIEGFRVRFLPPLDEIARRRIRRAATTAGKLTAISPRGAIDAIVVAALAIELVGDLCAIYNLKANRVETIQILGRVFLAAGIASQADDWTESASEGIFESLDLDALPGVLAKIFSKVAAPIVGAVADGAINAALLWRIGRRTVRAIRPLA